MTCKYCGNELENGATFCSRCGKIKEEEQVEEVVESAGYSEKERENADGELLKFSILGLGFGIGALLSYGILSILGLIFSYIARGKLEKYTQKYRETRGRASVGKKLSVAGVIVSWVSAAYMVFCIIYVIVMVILQIAIGNGDIRFQDVFPFFNR